jgi:hypothetical protein
LGVVVSETASAIADVGVQSAAGAESVGGIAGGAACGSGEVSPETGCEDAGLSVEVWDGAVIPNYVVCFLYLLTQVELGCHYFQCRLRRKPTLMGESEKLGVALAGHDDDTIELSRRSRFVKKRDVNQQPFSTGSGGFRKCGPSEADDGMKNGFQNFASVFVVEDELAEFRTIWSAGLITGFVAECRSDRIANASVSREQFMYATVGVEVLHR